jgi:hypothetical protein
MRNAIRFAAVVLSSAVSLAAYAAPAPVTQLLPATAGPITFASAAVGGGSSTVAVSIQLNASGSVTFTVPASANGHQEFTVGTVSCPTGTTVNTAGTVCNFNVTFAPYYPGTRSQPLVVTFNNQVYSFGLTGMGTGPLAHLDTTNISTITGIAGTSSTTAYTYNTGVPLGNTLAVLYENEGLFVDSSNNIYVADGGHNLIRVAYESANAQLACLIITENPTDFGLTAGANTCAGATSQPTVGDLYTIAGTTSAAYNGDNQLATSANFNLPDGVEVDPAGNVFIGDQGNSRVRVIYQGGATIACLIQIENPTVFGLPTGSTSCTAATSQPTPGFVYTIAGTGTSGYSGDGGLATAANLYTPNDTAIDAAGDVFMMNFTNSATNTIGGRIRVIYNGGALAAQLIEVENPTVTAPVVGDIYTVMGSLTTETGDGGLATAAGALDIYCVRIDAYDNVYFSDKTYGATSYGSATNQARIRVVYNGTASTPNPLANLIALENPSSVGTAANVKPGYVYTIAGETGTATQSAPTVDGVLATAQQFAGVYGFAFDAAGDIIVTDRLNYTIRRISAATGLINTVAGFPTSSSTANFIASGSSQIAPGNLPTTGCSLPDCIGQMFGPWGVGVDSLGGIFFNDYGGNRLRYVAATPSASYPLILPSSTVGTQSGIQYFTETNIGTPGSTLTISADAGLLSAAAPFGFLSPANAPGISECATTSTSTPQATTITTATSVSLASGKSCAFGVVATPQNGGLTAGTVTVTDNSGNIANNVHTMDLLIAASGVTTTLTYSPTPAVAGQPEMLTATLVTAAKAPVTAGSVTFSITGGATLGTVTLDPVLGTASITTSLLVSPSTSITTVYAGDTSVNAAFTPSTSVTVIPVSLTVVTLTSNNYAPNLGQSITLSAQTSSPVSSGSFTGTMTIYDGSSTVVCSGLVSSAGLFTCNTSTLAAGTHILKATYTGDPNYVSATSTTISVVVTAPAWTASLTSAAGIAIVDGSTGQASFQIATVGGYTGTITVSCGTPLPAGVSCAFVPSSYAFTGGNNTLTGTATIVTIYIQAGLQRHGGALLAGLLLPGAGLGLLLLRRRKALNLWQSCAVLLIGGGLLLSLGGCSNGVQTPKGTFNVPLIFTDGATTQTINETVSVIGTSDVN